MYFNPPAIQLIDNKELLFVCLSFSLEKKKKEKKNAQKWGFLGFFLLYKVLLWMLCVSNARSN